MNKPDENLVGYFNEGLLKPGNVLELGSGPGRNAIYFADKDCHVDAVDLSEESIDWAKEKANERGGEMNFIRNNIFDVQINDSGCFHHIAPHRRSNFGMPSLWTALFRKSDI